MDPPGGAIYSCSIIVGTAVCLPARVGSPRSEHVSPRVTSSSRQLHKHSLNLPNNAYEAVRASAPGTGLRSVRFVRAFERSLVGASERGSFRVVHYSLQGNHVHFIVEAAGREALGRGMKSLGAQLARCVNRVFERSGRVLGDRYHAVVLRSPLQVRRTLAYVLLNARKHAGRARSGPRAQVPVAVGRTWLLTTGWRRHGLIYPCVVPGGIGPRPG